MANATADHLLFENDDLPDPEHPVADLPQDLPPRSKHLSLCLASWRDNEEDIGSLSSMTPPCGFLTLQVIDIGLSPDGAPTGKIVLHDGHCYVSATVDPRYVVELKKRSWGMYSLLQIRSTTGLHTEFVVVSSRKILHFFKSYHPQTKCSHPKKIQLDPKRSLVSPQAPLCSLAESGDVTPLQPQPPLDNSILADGAERSIKLQLPSQHPARRLLISPADIRKKLSAPQIDDLLVMLGSNDFIKLVL